MCPRDREALWLTKSMGIRSVIRSRNGIQVSRDRWLIVYATRRFRGNDDDASIVFQVRKDAPDGDLIKEGMLVPSHDEWDPLGDGSRHVKQHGHPVAFGVPRGARIAGKPAPSANVFVLKWRQVARVLDHERNYLENEIAHPELRARTHTVEWAPVSPQRAGRRHRDPEAGHPSAPEGVTRRGRPSAVPRGLGS